jgi:ribonuclease P/MRP protein subunit RPP40
MATLISEQYCSMFSVPRFDFSLDNAEEILEVEHPSDISEKLEFVTVTRKAVQEAVTQLSAGAAPGPDGVAAVCIKQGGDFVITALTDIFSESLEDASAPNSMKKAFVSPIWKGEDRTKAANYRPVALTSHYSKILERVLRPVIVDHLEQVGALDQAQHGARAGRSTLSQLLVQYETIMEMLENGDNAEIVYLDFAKAFDKVDIGILLQKIAKFGITGRLWTWIASFLLGRTQSVRVGNALSPWEITRSSVPQGSVLGPLFFLIFISDLGGDLSPGAVVLKFVDDTKLIARTKNEKEVEEVQADLDKLYNWQQENNMEWNDSKFQILRMGTNVDLRESTLLFTPDMGDPILESGHVKDLGVLMDAKGTFAAQRQGAVKKTSQKAGWILRTFLTREVPTLRTLWKSLVQPHLDYASQLWYPALVARDIEEMEAPLRAFTRRMGGLRHLSYWKRLEASSLQSSERRAERYKIIYLWKVAKGIVPNFGVTLKSSNGRKGGLMFAIPSISGSRASVRTLKEKSLMVEGPRLFNALPAWMRDTDVTKDTFKVRLDAMLSLIPDQPRHKFFDPAPVGLSGRPSNSIRDWIHHLSMSDWSPVKANSSQC